MRDDQLWHYHAYDYAWRRMIFGDQSDRSPADPDGKWFNSALVEAAQDIFRKLPRERPQGESAADREAAEYRDQWARERGCDDFAHAMQIGLVAASRRVPSRLPKSEPPL